MKRQPRITGAALLLALTLTAGTLSGCTRAEQAEPETTGSPTLETIEPTPEPTPTPTPEEVEAETYTFRLCTTSLPDSWNCHTVSPDDDVTRTLLEATTLPLYDVVLDDGNGYQFQPELASGDPVDVTSQYALAENPWGIPEGASSGYVWQVSLNPSACWEDGTPITAQDLVDSMLDLLDPTLNNPCRAVFTTSVGELAYAAAYASGTAAEDQVGIFAVDDATLVFILANQVSQWNFVHTVGTARFLVNQSRYDSGRNAGTYSTDYATSVETFSSCGPYRVTEVTDEAITLTRNEAWYGWTDGQHEGEYQTTDLVFSLAKSYDSGLISFLSGQVSVFDLDGQDVGMYERSSALVGEEAAATCYLRVNSDPEALAAVSDGSVNAAILAEDAFRQALSQAIDRTELARSATSGGQAAEGLLNRCYFLDLEHSGISYRDTDEGALAVSGEEAEADEIASLFTQAAEAALENGTWDGEEISLVISVEEVTAEALSVGSALQRQLKSATVATALEDKLTIRVKEAPNGVADPAACALILATCSGAETSPLEALGEYLEGSLCASQTLTLTVDGLEVTRTLSDWVAAASVGGECYTASLAARLAILSGAERAVLDSYQVIPLYSPCNYRLISKQVELGSREYHILAGFGGLRAVTYLMNDADWAEYLGSGEYSAASYT